MDNLNVTEVFRQHHRIVRDNLAKAFGCSSVEEDEVVEKAKTEEMEDDVIKGEDIENPFERQARQDELEKSDIMDAISYDNEFKIKKTGKEIKEQIQSVLLPKKEAELEAKKAEADELLAECGDAPTSEWNNCCYGLDINPGYKRYNWEETCMKCDAAGEIYDSLSYEHQESSPKINRPKTKNEQDARCKYNRCVDIICAIMVDVKACEILSKNLKDGDEIKMSPRQIAVFKMD